MTSHAATLRTIFLTALGASWIVPSIVPSIAATASAAAIQATPQVPSAKASKGSIPPESLHATILAISRGEAVDSAEILEALLAAYGTGDAAAAAEQGLAVSARHPSVLGLVGRLTLDDANTLSLRAMQQLRTTNGAVGALARLVLEASAERKIFSEPVERLAREIAASPVANEMLLPTAPKSARWRRSDGAPTPFTLAFRRSDLEYRGIARENGGFRIEPLSFEGMLLPKSAGEPVRVQFARSPGAQGARQIGALRPDPQEIAVETFDDIPAGEYTLRLTGEWRLASNASVQAETGLPSTPARVDATIAVVVEPASAAYPPARVDEALAERVARELAGCRVMAPDAEFGGELEIPRALAAVARGAGSALAFVIEWRQGDARAVLGQYIAFGGDAFGGGGGAPANFDLSKPFRVAFVPCAYLGFAPGQLPEGTAILGCGFELAFASWDAAPAVATDCTSDAAVSLGAVEGDEAVAAIDALAATLKAEFARGDLGETLRIRGEPAAGAIGLSGRLRIVDGNPGGYCETEVAGASIGSLVDGGALELALPPDRPMLGDIRLAYQPDIRVAGTRVPAQRRYIAVPFAIEVRRADGAVRVLGVRGEPR